MYTEDRPMAAAGFWNTVMCLAPKSMAFGLSRMEERNLCNVSADITVSIFRVNESEDDSYSRRSPTTDRQISRRLCDWHSHSKSHTCPALRYCNVIAWNELTDRASNETIDRASNEMIDRAAIEMTDRASNEMTDRASNEMIDRASNEMIDRASNKMIDRASNEMIDRASNRR
jgi:hypothetical protein